MSYNAACKSLKFAYKSLWTFFLFDKTNQCFDMEPRHVREHFLQELSELFITHIYFIVKSSRCVDCVYV